MLFCTRFEREIGWKPGTEAHFCSSVPGKSGNLAEFRVQEQVFAHLYPIGAGNRTETGYRRRFWSICTRSEQEIGRKPGTEKHFCCSVPAGDESPYGSYLAYEQHRQGKIDGGTLTVQERQCNADSAMQTCQTGGCQSAAADSSSFLSLSPKQSDMCGVEGM